MKPNISLKQLQALAQVTQRASFTEAAKALGVSQPTVSNLVNSLEKQYSCKLLDRSGSEITPTPLLESVFGQLRAISTLAEELDTALSQARDLQAGRLNIGYSTYQIAMPVLSGFIQAYPKVTTNARSLASHDLLPLLYSGGFDLGFLTGKELPAGLDGMVIAPAQIGILMPDNHPLADKTAICWGDLAGQSLLQREPTSGTRRIFEAAATLAGQELNTALGLGSWGSIVSLVRAGTGLGIGFAVEFTGEQGLVFRAIQDPNLAANHYLACLPAMRRISAVAQFFDIAETLQAAPTPEQ
ncbi:MAG: LysR substrate-binding domain-containing protein [Mangrovicoccus sp.]|nr:LysR substrate-binding domain-containing protein [Mangrovicoccus sp.]